MMIGAFDRDIKNTRFIFGVLNENELKNNSPKKQSKDSNIGHSRMNNETFNFNLEGKKYVANFCYVYSSMVDDQMLFKGILSGNGNLIGHKCIVRTNSHGTEESWQNYLEVRKKLKSIEDIFRGNNCPLNFHVPKCGLAEMERAAFPSKVASVIRRWRRPKKYEWVLVDLYRYPRKEIICEGALFSAMSHISLMQSQGQSYLTNFRAFNFNKNKICVTNADISTDLAAFKQNHICTDLCWMELPCHRPEPIVIPSRDIRFGDFSILNREPMSAPPPYTEYEYPFPSAPPISYMHSSISFPNDYFFRQFSVEENIERSLE